MLSLFKSIKDLIKPRESPCIDNWVFKLHYRATTIILLICVILVTSREYIGDRIKCVTESVKYQHFIETYCFFSSTFSVITNSQFGFLFLPHGIQPYQPGSRGPTRKHLYYQWVPYVLFLQAAMFYFTHFFWKKIENERIRKIVDGLTSSLVEKKDVQIVDEERKKDVRKITQEFLQIVAINKLWTLWFVFFETLNLGNVILQIYITNQFLGKQFYSLGTKLLRKGPKILDEVFPKVTKCTFHKYGFSGTIETHDTLCVMALNIIIEKIYVFLWFWLAFLFSVSCFILIWRMLTVLLYSRSTTFNQIIFGLALQTRIYPYNLNCVIRNCSYSDWLLLRYLSKNMDSFVFMKLLDNICEEVEERKIKVPASFPNEDFEK